MVMSTIITVVFTCDDCGDSARLGQKVGPGFIVPDWALPEGWTHPERGGSRVHQCKTCTDKRYDAIDEGSA